MVERHDETYFRWLSQIWDEYKFRHNLYWLSVFLFGGAALAIYLIPFLRPENVRELRLAGFIFPILGLCLSSIGGWHVAAQRARLVNIGKRLTEMRDPDFDPQRVHMTHRRTWLQETVSFSISNAFVYLFIFGLAPFSLIDASFVYTCLNPARWPVPLALSVSLMVFIPIAVFLAVNKRRRSHNRRFQAEKAEPRQTGGRSLGGHP